MLKIHKKINKQKRLFLKKWTVKWEQTQIMRWKKDNLQIFTEFILWFSIGSLNDGKNTLYGTNSIR